MPHPSRSFAGVEVVPLCDAVGPMGPALARPLGELFGGPDHPVWSRPGAPDPAGVWQLHFHCYLLLGPGGRTVLVDTGLGGTDSPAAAWAPVPGRLMEELAAVGAAPEDVDTVVLTHLHSDHVSGSLAPDGATPAFPAARYVVQRAELRQLDAGAARGPAPVLSRVVAPLRAAGRLDVLDGARLLAPGIRAVPAPGHTPGHQCVTVGDGALVLSGDVLHHPVQLTDPTAAYRYDDDPAAATATRSRLLDELRSVHGTLATAHFPEPFTTLRPHAEDPAARA
ncbi:MBL fold metallo-hydrolase [Streptomyces sp. NPDC006733]|uniref:MBL fold metallo-hydrolase n=1 Tax=Streptomyces sp. NPDC006733 TaxID=3155460 RepID=UPI0034006272